MNLLCLGLVTVVLNTRCFETEHFILYWQHSVEHSGWYEKYRINGDRLLLVESAVQQSGAGMEPAPDATWADGWWVSRPSPPPELPELVLPDSDFTAPMQLCLQDRCQPLRQWLGSVPKSDLPVRLTAGQP